MKKSSSHDEEEVKEGDTQGWLDDYMYSDGLNPETAVDEIEE